jgi:serine/threonine protein kinase
VQIGDFGISMILEDVAQDKIENQNTSPLFTSPSALSTDENNKYNGKAADIWALGVTLYCFVHGHCPFEDADIIGLYHKIENEQPCFKENLSKSLKDLLDSMLKKNPTKRIKLEAIKAHPWVTEMGARQLLSTKENCAVEFYEIDDDPDALFKPASVVFKVERI